MNSKSIVIIIGVVLVITISVGLVFANQGQNPEKKSPTDASSIIQKSSPVPSGIAESTNPHTQPLSGPAVLDTSPIALDEARKIVRQTFPEFSPDLVNITYHPGDRVSQPALEFDVIRENKRLVQGALDPRTGNLTWYAIPVERIGRAADPSVTMASAQTTAEAEIKKRSGILSLHEPSNERYDALGMPDSGVAGVYVFVYEHLEKNDPCANDGFTIDVDSVSGKVIEYRKTWIQPPGEIC